MMFGYGSHWVFWQVALMGVGMVGLWALLIWAVFALVTGSSRRPSGPPQASGGGAGAILDSRIAPGEIDIEDYRRLRLAIGSDSRSLAGSAR